MRSATGPGRQRIPFVKPAAILLSFFFAFPAASRADYAVVTDNGYEIYAEEADPRQQEIKDAQATLSSLFGKNATLAIPPRMAGGTIMFPSVNADNAEINEEAAAEEPSSGAARNAQSAESKDL